jgi:pyruvate kinase
MRDIIRSMKIDASSFKKTKIVTTIGPASEEKVEQLLKAGVNAVRLNFSHGTHNWHRNVLKQARAAAKKLDRSVAVIADLQGPKIRLGTLPPGGVELKNGQKLTLRYNQPYSQDVLPTQFDLSGKVKKDDRIFIRDGMVKTEVLDVADNSITVIVKNSGKIASNHGLNLPDTLFDSHVILTQKDRTDLEFIVGQDVDYVALSFVQTAADVLYLRKMLQEHKCDAKIISKIETRMATENLEEIIAVSDAVMIARGDLAIETSNEDVPLIGRAIIQLARAYKRPVIMATQMLESMISSPQPTRAEVNDISTAVNLGVSCVMLSGETATGQYPVEVVELMKRVILKSEMYFSKFRMEVDLIPSKQSVEQYFEVEDMEETGTIKRIFARAQKLGQIKTISKLSDSDVQTSVSLSAITLAEQVGAKVILAETLTGSTACSIAALRPPMPIIIASPNERVCNQMSIVWGGKPFLVKNKDDVSKKIISELKKRGNIKAGDWVVQAFGKTRGVAGGTDTVRLIEVK